MKVLIIGLGSIAKKHILSLNKLIDDPQIFALRSSKKAEYVNGVKNIYEWNEIPKSLDFIIISNPTSEHYKTIEKCIDVGVPLFIEKPPLLSLDKSDYILRIIKKSNTKTYVAFNMRFHPIIQWLKNKLPLFKVIEVQCYCGSYLPDWRPGRDYKQVYSAKKKLGGGVHLDLIHELDYMRWIFGDPIVVNTYKGKKSNLEINSVDIAHYSFEYEGYYITILLNYFRRDPKRMIEIVMENETWIADILKSRVYKYNGDIIYQTERYNKQDTYDLQMKYFLENIKVNNTIINNFEDSLKTLEICLK